jgi:hypothetical protein
LVNPGPVRAWARGRRSAAVVAWVDAIELVQQVGRVPVAPSRRRLQKLADLLAAPVVDE